MQKIKVRVEHLGIPDVKGRNSEQTERLLLTKVGYV
jgi:hypothetical protein